jgi:uncharacterized protein (TIGR03382 family)
MRPAWTALPALAALVAAPALASAHIAMTFPLPRTTQQKQPHCGATGVPRSQNPNVFEPGATITVTWDETIGHPGHYRISFDLDGEDFTIPLGFDDFSQTDNVLVDNIPDNPGTGSYRQEITFPDEECENCTLQLIQMMTDKPPYGDGNDIYFLCADIALRRGGGTGPGPGAGPDAGTDPGVDDEPGVPGPAIGSCAAGPGGATIGSALLLLGVAALARRRRGVARQRTER